MNYISAKEAAKKWGIGLRRVQYYCSNDKIAGAKFLGKQWIIPADAVRPVDGRTKASRLQKEIDPYHFPVFLFSPQYGTDMPTCSEEELMLFDAQKLYLAGEYFESITLCRKILDMPISNSVKIGTCATICYCSMLLNLPEVLNVALKDAEKVAQTEVLHVDDFCLIVAGIKFHLIWNFDFFKSVQIEKLSPEALVYYKYLLMVDYTIQHEELNAKELATAEITCKECMDKGYSFLAMSYHAMLGAIYNFDIILDKRDEHVLSACKLALENNYVCALAKYYIGIKEVFDRIMGELDPSALNKLQVSAQKSVENWKISVCLKSKDNPYFNVRLENCSIFRLVSYDMSDEEIAKITGYSMEMVESAITNMCMSSGVKNRSELVAYAQERFEFVNKMPIPQNMQ